jgi:hypothetical protein
VANKHDLTASALCPAERAKFSVIKRLQKLFINNRDMIPTQDDIDELENDTLLVLDDLYDKAVNSECIDHLFRVTSGKRNLSVMIMTQNSYAQGRYARDIRNSCNAGKIL